MPNLSHQGNENKNLAIHTLGMAKIQRSDEYRLKGLSDGAYNLVRSLCLLVETHHDVNTLEKMFGVL